MLEISWSSKNQECCNMQTCLATSLSAVVPKIRVQNVFFDSVFLVLYACLPFSAWPRICMWSSIRLEVLVWHIRQKSLNTCTLTAPWCILSSSSSTLSYIIFMTNDSVHTLFDYSRWRDDRHDMEIIPWKDAKSIIRLYGTYSTLSVEIALYQSFSMLHIFMTSLSACLLQVFLTISCKTGRQLTREMQ